MRKRFSRTPVEFLRLPAGSSPCSQLVEKACPTEVSHAVEKSSCGCGISRLGLTMYNISRN
ncbi:MAG: hypothetical protein QXK85_02770, partial [Thermofilum sp.]